MGYKVLFVQEDDLGEFDTLTDAHAFIVKRETAFYSNPNNPYNNLRLRTLRQPIKPGLWSYQGDVYLIVDTEHWDYRQFLRHE